MFVLIKNCTPTHVRRSVGLRDRIITRERGEKEANRKQAKEETDRVSSLRIGKIRPVEREKKRKETELAVENSAEIPRFRLGSIE